MPKISIIIPIYNSSKYLKRAIECCINQSLKDIEIIFVDDKGQDNSVEIVQEYMQNDDRIKLVDNITNQGIFRAKRAGALNASGKYLMFLDPDDEFELNACEILYKEIEKISVDLIYFNGYIIRNKNKQEISRISQDFNIYTAKEFKQDFIKNKLQWMLWLKIYNKEKYLKALFLIDDICKDYKTNLTEDVVVFYHIVNIFEKIAIINKHFYNYYIYDTSVSNNLDDTNYYKCMKDYESAIDLINQSCIKNKFSKKFTQQYLMRLKLDKMGMKINYYKKNHNKSTLDLIKLRLIKILLKIKNIFIKL